MMIEPIRDPYFADLLERIRAELRELQCLLVANGFWPPGDWTLRQCREEARARGLLPWG